ncbi:MAG: hypothetical protein ACREV6_02810 [Clostridium sp.]|uniref:hypothetical protein n=1 Tax=Clostridium sp. TaxID=1506 RepID=UPI003D6CE08A
MSMVIIYTPKGKKTSFAIAGGKNAITSFKEMRFTDEQLDVCIPREDKLQYLNDKKYGSYGSMTLFSSLYSFFSNDKPLILYTTVALIENIKAVIKVTYVLKVNMKIVAKSKIN